MLTRLLPDQISKFWDVISYAVEQSLPPTVSEHPDKMNRILSSCLSGGTTVWASYSIDGNERKFEGVVLTRITYDDASHTKTFLIYCLYGYRDIDKESWTDGLITLAKYARKKGCARISAYTDREGVVKLSQQLGAVTTYTFISFDVNEIIKKFNDLMGDQS